MSAESALRWQGAHRIVPQALLQQPHTRTWFCDFDLKKELLLKNATSSTMLFVDGTPVPVPLQQSTIAEYGAPTEGKVVDY